MESNLKLAEAGWTRTFDYGGLFDGSGPGNNMARSHGLQDPKPIIASTRQSGNTMIMLSAGNKYYIWDRLEDEVWLIKDPTGEEKIVQKIADGKQNDLQLEQV